VAVLDGRLGDKRLVVIVLVVVMRDPRRCLSDEAQRAHPSPGRRRRLGRLLLLLLLLLLRRVMDVDRRQRVRAGARPRLDEPLFVLEERDVLQLGHRRLVRHLRHAAVTTTCQKKNRNIF